MDLDFGDDGVRIADADGDVQMDDDLHFDIGDQSAMPEMGGVPSMDRARISESPLSDIDENTARDVEEWTRLNNTSIYEPGYEPEEPEPQPQKNRRSAGSSVSTQLRNLPARILKSSNRTTITSSGLLVLSRATPIC